MAGSLMFLLVVLAFFALALVVEGGTRVGRTWWRRRHVPYYAVLGFVLWGLPWLEGQLDLSESEGYGLVYLALSAVTMALTVTQRVIPSRFPEALRTPWHFGLIIISTLFGSGLGLLVVGEDDLRWGLSILPMLPFLMYGIVTPLRDSMVQAHTKDL